MVIGHIYLPSNDHPKRPCDTRAPIKQDVGVQITSLSVVINRSSMSRLADRNARGFFFGDMMNYGVLA